MTELRRGISFSGQFSDYQSLLSRYFRAGGFTVPARVEQAPSAPDLSLLQTGQLHSEPRHNNLEGIVLATQVQLFVLNSRLSSSLWRSGASLAGNSDACASDETSRSPLRLKAGYFPGCEVMRMSTNDSGLVEVSLISCPIVAWRWILNHPIRCSNTCAFFQEQSGLTAGR